MGVAASFPPNPAALQTTYAMGLAVTELENGGALITVQSASPPAGPETFLVRLSVNGTAGEAVPMPTRPSNESSATVTAAGYSYLIGWSDADADRKVSTGDRFGIGSVRWPPPCCRLLTFSVLSAEDRSAVGEVSFNDPPEAAIPTVSLGAPTLGPGPNVFIPVDSVEPGTAPEFILFTVIVGYTPSQQAPIGSQVQAANGTDDIGTYVLAWYDNNNDSLVDAGDALNLSMVSGSWPSAGTSMRLYLDFPHGWPLAVAAWDA